MSQPLRFQVDVHKGTRTPLGVARLVRELHTRLVCDVLLVDTDVNFDMSTVTFPAWFEYLDLATQEWMIHTIGRGLRRRREARGVLE